MKRLVGINDDNSLKWDNLPKNTQKLIIRYTNRRESLLVSHQWNKCITKMKLDWFSILSPNWHLTLEEVILYYEPYSLQISDQPPSYAFKKQLAFLIDNFKCRIKDSLLARRMKEIVEKNLWGFHSGLLAYKNYHPLDFHIYFSFAHRNLLSPKSRELHQPSCRRIGIQPRQPRAFFYKKRGCSPGDVQLLRRRQLAA